jgi:hypothetical protein
MSFSGRVRASFRVLLAFCAAFLVCDVAFAASARFSYLPNNGYAGSGTVTFPDALLAPNTLAGEADNLNGLTSASITITGPGLPGGTLTIHRSDLEAWYFETGASGQITDLNFFQPDSITGCHVNGDFTFVLAVFCEGEEVASLALTDLVVAVDPLAVPALQPAWLVVLMLVLAAGGAWLSRRRTTAIRTR